MLFRALVHATANDAPTIRSIFSFRWMAAAMIMALAVLGFPLAAHPASQGNSSAFGESVDLHLLPLLGNTVNLTSGPLPFRSGAAPPAFDLTQQVASVNVSSPLLGTVLQTGILRAHAASSLPGQDSAIGNAEVNGLALRIAGALPLLTLGADTIVSSATITGPCTSAPTATGATTLTNVVLGGPLGLGLTVPVHPAPNFVLLNLLGIRVVLNEQIATGTGLTRALTVNAIHITVNNSVLSGLGVLSGDITIAQSKAGMTCELPPPPDNADLSMSALATPGQMHVGDSGQFEFEIGNLGPSAATQIAFSGGIAGPGTVQSIATSQGSCTGGATFSCTIGTLPAGGSATVVVNVRATALGFITGTGGATSPIVDPVPSDNQATASIEVRASEVPPPASADLGLSATTNPAVIHVNDTASAVFRIDNYGPNAAAQVTLSGSVTGATTILSVVTSQGSCVGTTSPSCSIGTIAAGGFVTVTVQHRPTATGTIVCAAAAASTTADPTPGNNQVSVSANVLPATGPPPASADLGLTATASPQVVHVNDAASITFRIANNGPNAAANVALAGSITGATAILSIASTQGSCSGTASPSCALGTVAAGGFVTITVQHRPTAIGTIVGTASVATTTTDPTPGNNQASVSANVLPASGPPPASADLAITASAAPLTVHVNDSASTIFRIDNHGPNAAVSVALSGSITGATGILSVATNQGACSGTTNPSCSLGTIPAGSFVIVTVQHRPSAVGTIVGSAAVGSTTSDPTPGNNQASVSANVLPATGPPSASADLVATIVDTPDPVAANGNVTYRVTVTNTGPDPASGARLAIDLPSRGTLVSMATNRGACAGTVPVVCSLGALAKGQAATVTVVVRAPSLGTLTLTATAAATTSDPNLTNNRVSASTRVATAPPLPAAHRCDVDDVPAATLLFPFFEVQLDDPNGKTTMISIVNSAAAGHLARVTLWTDCSVPSMSFDVYLTGFDVQTINLRDLFNGKVPQTGLGLSPRGELSDVFAAPAGCPSQGTVAAGLSANQISHVRAWHTGQRSPLSGTCASLTQVGTGEAFGYVTVDAVRRCSTLTPADKGYFGVNGVASNDNVLWGDFAVIDGNDGSAKGDMAVHIVAEPGIYKTGNQTFYGRYVNGSGIDNRRPLGTAYASRYMEGEVNTELMVWRDTKVAERNGFTCGQRPSWFPLEQRGVVAFDEEENAIEMPISDSRMPVALQKVQMGTDEMPTPADFGWVYIDLWHKGGLFGNVAQGWVTTTMEGAGANYSIGQRTLRMDSACDKF